MLKTDQAVLAKFVLSQDFAFEYPERKANFWKDMKMEVGFIWSEITKPTIDGLQLAMRDTSTAMVLSEFTVPWGDNHYLRKRGSTRLAS